MWADDAKIAFNDLAARVAKLEIPPPVVKPALWQTSMETGDLSGWYIPGPLGSPNNKPAGAGGAEFDSGAFTPASVVADPLGQRGNVVKMQIDAGSQESGIRLFRFLEPETDSSGITGALGPGLYYSAWFLIPQLVTVGSWWGLMQWKSNGVAEGDNPMFIATVHSSPNGLYLWMERAAFSKLPSLPPQKSTFPLPINRWFRLSAFYKGRPDGTGRVTAWQDGNQFADFQNVQTRYADGDLGWSILNYGQNLTPAPTVVYAANCAISAVPI